MKDRGLYLLLAAVLGAIAAALFDSFLDVAAAGAACHILFP